MTSEHNVFRIFVAPTRYSVSFQFYSRSTSGTNCTSEKYGCVKSPRVRLRLKVCGLIVETYFSFFKKEIGLWIKYFLDFTLSLSRFKNHLSDSTARESRGITLAPIKMQRSLVSGEKCLVKPVCPWHSDLALLLQRGCACLSVKVSVWGSVYGPSGLTPRWCHTPVTATLISRADGCQNSGIDKKACP